MGQKKEAETKSFIHRHSTLCECPRHNRWQLHRSLPSEPGSCSSEKKEEEMMIDKISSFFASPFCSLMSVCFGFFFLLTPLLLFLFSPLSSSSSPSSASSRPPSTSIDSPCHPHHDVIPFRLPLSDPPPSSPPLPTSFSLPVRAPPSQPSLPLPLPLPPHHLPTPVFFAPLRFTMMIIILRFFSSLLLLTSSSPHFFFSSLLLLLTLLEPPVPSVRSSPSSSHRLIHHSASSPRPPPLPRAAHPFNNALPHSSSSSFSRDLSLSFFSSPTPSTDSPRSPLRDVFIPYHSPALPFIYPSAHTTFPLLQHPVFWSSGLFGVKSPPSPKNRLLFFLFFLSS